ncbi:MAG: glycosyltransferase family 2 protein [Microgenomates group bacterium]
MKPDITAVVLAKNEEENLPRCLKSLNWVKEIILIDDYSTDKTVEIAKSFGAKVYQRKLDNFQEQRNWALKKVKTSWVLMVDPDEEVSAEMRQEILEVVEKNQYDGFRFPRKNIIFGKWIKHTGWYPDWQLHLFKTKKGRYEGKVHEQVVLEGKVGVLKNHLIHYNYHSISQYLQKLDKYTSLAAEEKVKEGYKFHYQDLLIKPAEEFFRRFFAEEGWKDGVHGLALSLLQAFSEGILYLKMWERENFKKEQTKDYPKIMEKIANDLFWWLAKGSSLKDKVRLKIKRKI